MLQCSATPNILSTDMREFAFNVSALLVSISLLLLGNGLAMTLLGVRAQMEGFSTVITGFLMSAYFIGYIFGALAVPKMVAAVGHVRVFAALASITSVSAIMHVVWVDPFFWAALRVLTGFCLVGLYMVTESWLNEQSSNENRGQVFSAYMIINLGSVAMGQQLLQVADPAGIGLFVISTVLFSLAVVPLSLVQSATAYTKRPYENYTAISEFSSWYHWYLLFRPCKWCFLGYGARIPFPIIIHNRSNSQRDDVCSVRRNVNAMATRTDE
ncbi:MAG TPA: hypothetical protein EYQ41_05690 [Micavibrio sp.]|nr:hypothetical protein [Micavibrio sp.]